jgi:hypothetical protein
MFQINQNKSIKTFIPIITLSVLHFHLQEGPPAAAGGSAGCVSAPAAPAALASAAALDPAAELKEDGHLHQQS